MPFFFFSLLIYQKRRGNQNCVRGLQWAGRPAMSPGSCFCSGYENFMFIFSIRLAYSNVCKHNSYLGFLGHDPPPKISVRGLDFQNQTWNLGDIGIYIPQLVKQHFWHHRLVEQQKRPCFEEIPPKHRVGMNVFSSCPNNHLFVSILQSAVQHLRMTCRTQKSGLLNIRT